LYIALTDGGTQRNIFLSFYTAACGNACAQKKKCQRDIRQNQTPNILCGKTSKALGVEQ